MARKGEPWMVTAFHLRRRGWSITEIARELGIPRSTVGDLLKGLGEYKPPPVACCVCGNVFRHPHPLKATCSFECKKAYNKRKRESVMA